MVRRARRLGCPCVERNIIERMPCKSVVKGRVAMAALRWIALDAADVKPAYGVEQGKVVWENGELHTERGAGRYVPMEPFGPLFDGIGARDAARARSLYGPTPVARDYGQTKDELLTATTLHAVVQSATRGWSFARDASQGARRCKLDAVESQAKAGSRKQACR
eukprot:1191613-Prorocentrum_minimum.AAC.4